MERIYVPAREAEDWAAHLASPSTQWRVGRSAYELAHAWQGSEVPETVANALGDSAFTELQNLRISAVLAERKTPLPARGFDSQIDALVLAGSDAGPVVVAVEGKAGESFDVPVKEWLADGGENRARRLEGVCELLGLDPAEVQGIEWQLLHRTAAALIEAELLGARTAVMLVHSFSARAGSFPAYREFLSCFGIEAGVDRVFDLGDRGGKRLLIAWVADQPRSAIGDGSAEDLFRRALGWLQQNYKALSFCTERDMERAVQARITWLIRELGSPLRVFHNHGLPTATGQARKADLVVLAPDDTVELAAELKYEPAHSRSGKDIWPTKFDVTCWKEICADVDYVRDWVNDGQARVGYAVLLDEDGYYKRRSAAGTWETWPKTVTGYPNTHLLIARFS